MRPAGRRGCPRFPRLPVAWENTTRSAPTERPREESTVMPMAFLYHFHGLGHIDFSEMTEADLPQLEALAVERDLEVVPTVYLRRPALDAFVSLVEAYGRYRREHPDTRIRGF